MNAIVILGLILFILMLIFGGKTGLVSFLTLFLNFIILFITVLAIVFGAPIYVVTFIFCIIVSMVNLFLLNRFNTKTLAAFIASTVTTLLMIVAVYLSVHWGHLQGFTQEEQDETYIFSLNIGIDMEQFMIFTVLLAVIAAVIDLAITISSPVFELHETNPSLSERELFHSGMRARRPRNFSDVCEHDLSRIDWRFNDNCFLVFQLALQFRPYAQCQIIYTRSHYNCFRRGRHCSLYSDYGYDNCLACETSPSTSFSSRLSFKTSENGYNVNEVNLYDSDSYSWRTSKQLKKY